MKIVFNPSYDCGFYVDLSKNKHKYIGTKIVGLAGLLEYLSMCNGKSGRYPSDGDRVASYLLSVQKCVKDSIVATTFDKDNLGVAKCLLQWRDRLIMAGWTPKMRGTNDTRKINLLGEIETEWQSLLKGDADRWRELAELSERGSLLGEGDSIECTCAKRQLPMLVQKVLESCGTSFVEYPEEMLVSAESNIKVVHYKDLSDVYRQVAAYPEKYKSSVLINKDNVSLNHILLSWGRPLQDATYRDSNPMALQLFKLSMSVFSRPLNIKNIVSYLQLSKGVISEKLSYKLLRVLLSGGFGEESKKEIAESVKGERKTKWNQEIENYIETATGEKDKKERIADVALINYITDDSIIEDEKIKVEELKKYIKTITNRIGKRINNKNLENEVERAQFQMVISYFKQLENTLEGMSHISYEELEKRIRIIYQPVSMTQSRAQVGSLNIVDSCTQILDIPESLVWLDCCGVNEISDAYEFLSVAERKWLNEQDGVCVPSLSELLDMNRKEMLSQITKVKGEITLITSDYHHNEKMMEHALIAELKMLRGADLTIEEGDTELEQSEPADVKRLENKTHYEIGNIGYKGRRESNTSLDKLINYPFDYTVEYIAQLKTNSSNELISKILIKGNVAHYFVQCLVEDSENNVAKMRELLNSEFEIRVAKSVSVKGLELMLKENEVEYIYFKNVLKQSVDTLITIMEEKGLTPEGCEVEYDDTLGKIGDFTSRIDLILRDKNGKYVIIDLKWSESKRYADSIKEGKAIQLELYRKVLEIKEKKVVAVGYYCMPLCVLITSDYERLEVEDRLIINKIEKPSNGDSLFEQIQNSTIQRMEEINKGMIEEGEMLEIQELPYLKALEKGEKLLPIGSKKNKAQVIIKENQTVYKSTLESKFEYKTKSYESGVISANEKATTYPLMKGRLK